MPVKILSREYTNQFKPASTTNWLLGNVGDWQKLTLQCEFATEIIFSIQETLTLQPPNIMTLNSGKTWGELGFYVGANFDLIFDVLHLTNPPTTAPNNQLSPITITNINGSTIETAQTLAFPYGQILPIRNAEQEVFNVRIISYQNVEGIELAYDHVSNNNVASGNVISFIDGTQTLFKAEDTHLLSKYPLNTPVNVDFNLTPFQIGMSIDRVHVEFKGSQQWRNLYDIHIYYMVSAFSDDVNNLLDRIAPSVLLGSESIADTFLVRGFPVYNNPNVEVSNDPKRTSQEGNVGWFDENYNQLPNVFTFTPVVYKNASGTIVNQLDYANPVTVTTTISGINNLATSQCQYGFIWSPLEEDYYKNTPYPYHQNTKVSTGGEGGNLNDVFPVSPIVNSPFPLLRLGYTVSGETDPTTLYFVANDATMDASDISFVQNGSDLDVTMTFRPNANFATFMGELADNERQYALWVSVGDQNPDINQSDRVSLLLDVNTMDTFIEPIGDYDGLTIDFLDHPQDSTDTPVLCGNSIYLEDDLLAKVSFQIDTDTSPTIPVPTGITFGVLTENTTTGQQYILDSNSVDLTVYPDPTQFNFDQSRGFKLGTGNTKNWFKVDHDPTNDSGTLKGVLGWYGYKIRWEDWIKRVAPVAPLDFYDNTEKQNGQNNDWFHYFETAGWNLYFYVDIDAVLDGVTVRYQNLRELTVKDYDVNSTISTEIKYYRNIVGSPDTKGVQLTTGDPLVGVIVENEKVWLDIEYTSTVPVWVDQAGVDANTYATSCSEVFEGAGQLEFRQLSSIWGSEFDNPMIPIPGETLAKVTFISTTVLRVECRIDANKLIDAPVYKITGRLGCK